jgi:hypothetical protein
MTKRWLFIAGFATLFTVGSIVHGSFTGRWKPLPPIDTYSQRLMHLPAIMGPWVAVDAPLDDPDSLASAGIQAYFSKSYRNQQTHEQISVLVVCGRPGPISVHTPDICYRSAGYTATNEPSLVDLKTPANKKVRVWSANFLPPSSRVGALPLQIQWTWIGEKGIESPANARLAFAFLPALFKIYIVAEDTTQSKHNAAIKTSADSVNVFTAEFLIAAEEILRNP